MRLINSSVIKKVPISIPSSATVIFNILLLLCASFATFASIFMLVGLAVDCRQLLLPWILAMVADISVEATHFIYVVSYQKVRLEAF